MTAPVYNGNAANISPAAPVNIASSTNATPIIFQTSAPHGLLDGQDVNVQGHQVNTAGNGIWQIGVTDSTHFKALGSVGNGVGAATGTVQSLTPTAGVTLVDGSTAPTAGAFNTPSEANLDIGAYLFERTGAYKLVKYAHGSITDDTGATWNSFTFTADSTWTALGTPTTLAAVNSSPFVSQSDLIVAEFDFNARIVTGLTGGLDAQVQFALFANMPVPGGTPPYIRVPGSLRKVAVSEPGSGSNSITVGIHLSSAFAAGSGSFPTGNSLGINLTVQAWTPSRADIASQIVTLIGDYTAQIRVYRLTGVPQ